MKETAQAATLSRPKKIISALMSGVLVIGLAPMVHAPAQAYADDGANTFTVTETSIDLSTQGLNYSPTLNYSPANESAQLKNLSPDTVAAKFIAAVDELSKAYAAYNTAGVKNPTTEQELTDRKAELDEWYKALMNRTNWSADAKWSPATNFSPSVYYATNTALAAAKKKLDDLKIELVQAEADTYSVTVSPSEHGTVDADPKENVKKDATVTLTIKPVNGYELDDISAKGDTDVTLSGSGLTRTFKMPAADVTVTATFKAIETKEETKDPTKEETKDPTKEETKDPTTNGGTGGAAQQPTTTTPTTTDTTTPAATTTTDEGIAKGETATVGASTVKATGEDTVTYVAPKNKKAKKITVPATVTINGKTYKVTAIAAKAFKGSKATTVVLGKNIAKIGKNAFKGSKVKTVTLKTSKLKKASFKNMLKGSKIKTVKLKGVNKKTAKKYKKWAKAYGVKVK